MSKRRFRIFLALAVVFSSLGTGPAQATAAVKKPTLDLSHTATQHTVLRANFPNSTVAVAVTLKGKKTYTATTTTTTLRTGSFTAWFPLVASPSSISATAGAVHISVPVKGSQGQRQGQGEGSTSTTTNESHLALVYRGPAACNDGCPEAAAALLKKSPYKFTVQYVGPNDTPITPELLKTADIYVQPGGGDDLDTAWQSVQSIARPIRDFVKNGGHYLGFCMGGYLAGQDPGYNLLPGDAGEYVGSPGATVKTTDDALVQVSWRGKRRAMFFQDGNYVTLNPGAKATVLAKFPNNEIAAVVTPYGKGKVGVSGPHPEADQTWYSFNGLDDPDGVDADLGLDLIDTLMN
jgi:glutamine amidotransferase-like uncharacterized protein